MATATRAVLLAVCLAMLIATASAVTCKTYNQQSQAGSRCHTPNTGDACCAGGKLWCDMGRCSLREVSESEKLKQCKMFGKQAGDRCDINNGMCCEGKLRCNVGRCSA